MDNVSKINNAMQNLTTQIAKKTQLNVAFKEQVGSKISAINTLIADIKDKMSNFSKTQDEVNRLSTQIQNLNNDNTKLQEEIARLEQLSKEHGVTQAQLEEAIKDKKKLENQLQENNATLATTQNQRQDLQQSLESIFEQLDANIGKLEDLTPDTTIINQLEQIRGDLATLSGTPPPTDDIPPPSTSTSTPPAGPSAAGDDTSSLSKSQLSSNAKEFTPATKSTPKFGIEGNMSNYSEGIPSQTQRIARLKQQEQERKQMQNRPPTGGKTRRHRKRRVSKRKTLKRKKLKGGYTADFEKKNKELRDKMRKRSKRHHSLRRPSSSTRKLSTSSKSSRRYKRSH